MSYNTNDIMGYAQDPIVFSNEQGGNELYEKVKEVMCYLTSRIRIFDTQNTKSE